jgi:hypothetical protein
VRRTARLNNSIIKFGSFTPRGWDGFTEDDFPDFSCEESDRREATVTFHDSLSGRNPTFNEPAFTEEPVVIVTPRVDSERPDPCAFPVGVITKITKSSFTVSFRNTGSAGHAVFDWIAVNLGQLPGGNPPLNRGIRLGMLSPNYFRPTDMHDSNISLPVPLYKR